MLVKYLAAIVAVALVLAYLGAIVFKLKDPSLAVVVAIGVTMMLIDLWQSLQRPQD
jgi:hypothetical protein